MKYNQPITKVLAKSPELMQETLPVVESEGSGQLGNEVEFDDAQNNTIGSTKSVWED